MKENEKTTSKEERGSFSGRMGFVIAGAASAVGLGNLWRFPYLTSHYGGGIFVLVYIIIAVTFGFSLMVAEISLGRKTGKSCVGAFAELSQKHKWIGWLIAIVPALIVPYYSVIGGWVVKWFTESTLGHLSVLAADSGAFWWNYVTGAVSGFADPSIFFLIFAALCIICVALGVEKGIEKVSKVVMPLLLVLLIVIIAYEFTIPGIWDGIVYYLYPDFTKLSAGTVLGAASQIFYSMSLAMGIMITYGSYTKKDVSIEGSARNISLIDTSVAILAGFLIVPAAFMFGLQDKQGMGLMFSALPQVFNQMPGGEFVGPLFYLLVIFAAMTSAMSILEAVVSVFIDGTNMKRKKSVIVSSLLLIIIGLITCVGFPGGPLTISLPIDQGAGVLGVLDWITNYFLMPIVALLTCIFVGYIIKITVFVEEVEVTDKFKTKNLFIVMIKYICPIFLILILVESILEVMGLGLM